MTPANCQERHLSLQLERDAVVGTSLHLVYSTCTLPEPNAVQIYHLLKAHTASTWWWEKKDADVICEILSKSVNKGLERAKFRNGCFAKLSLVV